MRGLMMKSKNSSATLRDSFRQVHTTACPNWIGLCVPGGASSMMRTCAVDDTYVGLPRVNLIHNIFTMLCLERVETANKDPLPLVPFGWRRYGAHFHLAFSIWGVESL